MMVSQWAQDTDSKAANSVIMSRPQKKQDFHN